MPIIAVLFLRAPLGLALGWLAPLVLAAALLAVPVDEARAHSGLHQSGFGIYPLHCAAGIDGDLAAVIHLLGSAHGIDVNARDNGGPYHCKLGNHSSVSSRNGYTPLDRAAEYDRGRIAATLIAAGADVNAKNNLGETPLHFAAEYGHAAIAAALIAAGADVNARAVRFQAVYNIQTPLQYAAYYGRQTVRAVLLANCANGFVVNPAGQCMCVSPKVETNRGRCEVVAVCDSPAALDAAANRCDCPAPNVGADGAVAPGNCAAPSESVCAGLNPPLSYDSSMGECVLTSASCTAVNQFYNGTDCDPFKSCRSGATLNRDANLCECAGAAVLNQAGTSCLCESPNLGTPDACAAPSESVCAGLNPPEFFDETRVSITMGECVSFMSCPSGAAVDRETNTCEFSAESCGSLNPPRLYDSNVGECGDPLYPCHDSAVRKADNSGCECPAKAYAHGDPSGGEWIRPCERYRYSNCVRYGEWRKSIPDTAECHADHAPLAHDLGGWRAAIRANNPTLVAHFIDDHEQDPDAGEALHWAAQHDSHLAALALIEGGADVNKPGRYHRKTPLHEAVEGGHAAVAKVLLSRGANPDATDSGGYRADGDTPLHFAARLFDTPDNVALVSLLLDKGADPNIRNDDGWRPLDLAFGKDDSLPPRKDVMAALIAWGANWSHECSGGAIPNEHYRGVAQVAIYPECRCPPHLSERDGGGECVCLAHSHAQVNGRCLPKDSAQVELEIEKMRAELEELRALLAALNVQLTLAADGPPEMLEEVAKQAEVAARGIIRRRDNFLALARAGLAEADDAGPAPALALSDTEATCRMLEGEVQTHSRTGAKICSGIDHNDTFCIVGSASAFPCVGLFRHVRQCNDDFNRPALDPWHCAARCPSGLRARGARCAAD